MATNLSSVASAAALSVATHFGLAGLGGWKSGFLGVVGADVEVVAFFFGEGEMDGRRPLDFLPIGLEDGRLGRELGALGIDEKEGLFRVARGGFGVHPLLAVRPGEGRVGVGVAGVDVILGSHRRCRGSVLRSRRGGGGAEAQRGGGSKEEGSGVKHDNGKSRNEDWVDRGNAQPHFEAVFL